MVSYILLVYGLHGVRCSFREADTCILYPLMFSCRGGGCVLCMPSLWLLSRCVRIVLIRICISLFLDKDVSIAICCSSLSASILCVCSS